ncbi:MGMT family protein [Sporosalibacterium faouarense]|uniref:MGMT family protein n=1 Tax=Sporosalibacterium faouarense TaxID=516123 RepID=UPI00192AE0CC|nr:MGMT family protein [Sporosalibacterium faouarense]
MTAFTAKVIKIIKNIPKGKVMTYGQIAAEAGSPRGARQVVRVLHSMSDKYQLPWHRVVNRNGEISLKGENYHIQKQLLDEEGVCFRDGRIDLGRYLNRSYNLLN